jgi:hypothetical protein
MDNTREAGQTILRFVVDWYEHVMANCSNSVVRECTKAVQVVWLDLGGNWGSPAPWPGYDSFREILQTKGGKIRDEGRLIVE